MAFRAKRNAFRATHIAFGAHKSPSDKLTTQPCPTVFWALQSFKSSPPESLKVLVPAKSEEQLACHFPSAMDKCYYMSATTAATYSHPVSGPHGPKICTALFISILRTINSLGSAEQVILYLKAREKF